MPPSSSSSILAAIRDDRPEFIVTTLNAILDKLAIPVTLESPHDLTPSLLIAILESILKHRLPIRQSIREARSFQSKVEAMKVFLGVLENDVVQEDIGLSEVDPRRLALGEWDEVVVIGEVLCTVGKTSGIISDEKQAESDRARQSRDVQKNSRRAYVEEVDDSLSFQSPPRTRSHRVQNTSSSFEEGAGPSHFPLHSRIRADSPSTRSATTSRISTHSGLSLRPVEPGAGSDTTVLSGPPDSPGPSPPPSPPLSDIDFFNPRTLPRPKSPQTRPAVASTSKGTGTSTPSRTRHFNSAQPSPRCIHEVDGPSFIEVEGGDSDNSDSHSRRNDFSANGASVSFCNCSARFAARSPSNPKPASTTPVRTSGRLGMVDFDEELQFFEESRRRSMKSTPSASTASRMNLYAGLSQGHTPKTALSAIATPGRVLTRHNSPTQYTLALMSERAKLMEELAAIKGATPR